MLIKKRFVLNRIISPAMGLADFVRFTAGLGLSKIELRNDLPGKREVKDIIDGLKPADVRMLTQGEGVSIISINALQQFNLLSSMKDRIEELKRMLELASAVDCPAVVLCPNNEKGDIRTPNRKYADTVEALAEYGPLFAEYGIAGYVEPLGFGTSSLASLPAAVQAIKASGYGCYRTVFDTFHHYIGPDNAAVFGMDGLGASYEIPYTGLVHISGVEGPVSPERFLDEHRILIGPKDRMGNKELIGRLDRLGYQGFFSFEPFSAAVQHMQAHKLAQAVEESLQYIGAR
ncbi:MAG: TIM barrel protein [Treponema sp.]|jgi:2-keto-myo-inositol isomerase|nr:TIM barrel protein [Treponema sp.]